MDPLYPSLIGLRWQDCIDIVLNSYILFRLYVLFRGTNVIRMVIAIAMLWMVERLALAMGLIITSWAMQGIIAVAALIIIIVFRNEIAGVLQTRSLKSFFWGIPRQQLHTPIEIIVASVYELARHNVGALLVLPMKKEIESVVHGGVPWQGKLSREMLLTVFWNGTPVHDGATIIQGDRVVEVAAILPLSKRPDFPACFGTRHRAAAGLAEQTDALVIVVSEERGQVTVFKDQAIINIEDNLELENVLRRHAGTTGAGNGARRQLVELGIAGLFCLSVITGIWFSFTRGLETLVTMEVPVEFMNRDPGMELFASSTSSVKLQLSGSGTLIKSVHPDQVKVKLDLANAVAGSNQIAVTRDSIVLPPGIGVKQVEPAAVEVNLDVPARKTVAVQVDWSGKLPKGLLLTDVRLTPETVGVVGGKLTLQDLATIYTEKIPLDNLTGDGRVFVGLVLQPPSLKLEDESKNRVEVSYTIARKPAAAIEAGR